MAGERSRQHSKSQNRRSVAELSLALIGNALGRHFAIREKVDSGLARGAYVLADAPGSDPEVILIGTGSEVALCLQAYEQLSKEGVRARVVSMPSWELFDDQDRGYRESVLPQHVKARVSVEQASDFGWSKYTGSEGHSVCI